MSGKGSSKQFLLTGFSDKEKVCMISIIESLQAKHVQPLVSSEVFVPTCTHVIAKKQCRSEKYLCACATGKWLLAGQYLIDSKKAGKWLNEADYEWGGGKYRGPFPDNMQEAPKRLRLALSKQGCRPPFHNWCIGIRSSADRSRLYKRLVEVAGGQAVILPSTNDENLTHVIAEKDLKNSVKQYHKKGIPTVRCEFLAQHLLQCPTPPVSKYSLFTNTAADQPSSSTSQNLSSTKVPISDDNLKKSMEGSQDSSRASIIKHKPVDSPSVPASNRSMLHSHLNSLEIHHPATIPKPNKSNHSESTIPSKRSEALRNHGAATSSKSSKTASVHESMSLKRGLNSLSSEISDKKSLSSSGIPTARKSTKTGAFAQENKNATLGPAKPTDSTSAMKTEKQSLGNGFGKSDERTKLLNHGRMSRDNARQRWEPPDWLKKKRSQVQEAQKKILSQSDSLNHTNEDPDPPSAAKVPTPRRFGKRELEMLEIFVDLVHSPSILLTCGMLMSKTLYPPPDLLYLLMKKYVLDSDSQIEAGRTMIFLNTLLELHPPTASHIRHDDIYMQALATTDATESRLLSSAKLKPRNKISLWNSEDFESVEWNFLHSVLMQAMLSTSPMRRQHAISLLTFLTTVLETHPKLTKEIFWPKSQKIFYSKAIKSIFTYFRQSIEEEIRSTAVKENLGSAEKVNVENENAKKNEKNDAESTDDSDDDSIEDDQNSMTSNPYICLKKIVNSLIAVVVSANKNEKVTRGHSFIASGLAEVFRDADDVVLENMLYTVNLPSKTSLICLIMEKIFCSDLAKTGKDTPLSLRMIVNRYFHFLPRPPTLNAKKRSPIQFHKKEDKKLCSTSSGGPGQRHESSDKENFLSAKLGSSTTSSAIPEPTSRFSAASLNRRNHKGETPLHKACMQNQPDKVAQLLRMEGINPNARDNAGWTPLGEACNHGNDECVRELLRLPLASFTDVATDQETEPVEPRLEIDLLACPNENGTTPLHDALDNGHVEVARLLFEKGGVELLYVTDKQGRTPLDTCATEATKNLVLQIACEISTKKQHMEDSYERNNFSISSTKAYQKVLPSHSILTCSGWKNSCSLYTTLVQHLVSAYISESRFLQLLFYLSMTPQEPPPSPEAPLKNDVMKMDVETSKICPLNGGSEQHNPFTKSDSLSLTAEQDLFCLCSWHEIEEEFQKHLRVITGDSSFVANEFACFKTDFVKSAIHWLKT